ncbi:hypothetical protein NPIL_604271, partial [Nephila pilipes]
DLELRTDASLSLIPSPVFLPLRHSHTSRATCRPLLASPSIHASTHSIPKSTLTFFSSPVPVIICEAEAAV